MNINLIIRSLLLGALLLSGIARAETEDIPLPGDVQNAPLKGAKKPAHHHAGPAGQGVHKHASKTSHKHRAATKHHKRYASHSAKHAQKTSTAANSAESKPATAAHKKHAKKFHPHKHNKNNKLKKKAGKPHKKLQ